MIFAILFSFILSPIPNVYGDGNFVILHSSNFVKFLPEASSIQTSDISKVILSSLGLPLQDEINWNGLLQGNIFQRPKAVAIFSVSTKYPDVKLALNFSSNADYKALDSDEIDIEGIMSSIEAIDWQDRPLILELSSENQLYDVKSNQEVYLQTKSLEAIRSEIIIRDSSSPSWISKLSLKSLNPVQDSDMVLIAELYMIDRLIQVLKSTLNINNRNCPDVIHFKLTEGLKSIQESYPLNSPQVEEAKNLIENTIKEVNKDLKEIFRNSILLLAVTYDSNIATGNKNRKLTSSNETTEGVLNLGPKYDPDYPVMFNIILWFSIAFSIAIFWITWGIWNMDPGRDSVIYRMTTQRIKRD